MILGGGGERDGESKILVLTISFRSLFPNWSFLFYYQFDLTCLTHYSVVLHIYTPW